MPSHNLFLQGSERQVQGYVNRALLGEISLCVSGIGLPVTVQTPPLEDVYLLHLPLAGEIRASVDGQPITAADSIGFILSPGARMHLDMSEGAIGIQVQVPGPSMRRHLASLLGGSPGHALTFDPCVRRSAARARGLVSHLRLIMETLDAGGFDSPLLLSESGKSVLSLLLLAQPNTCSRWLDQPQQRAPGYLLRVEAYMRDNLDRAISACQLVSVAGVSERTLYNAFVAHRGLSPMRKLKAMRLQAVRQHLMGRARSGLSVTDVAMQYCFYQLGRFSAEYKEAFGELPSETLRRCTDH